MSKPRRTRTGVTVSLTHAQKRELDQLSASTRVAVRRGEFLTQALMAGAEVMAMTYAEFPERTRYAAQGAVMALRAARLAGGPEAFLNQMADIVAQTDVDEEE